MAGSGFCKLYGIIRRLSGLCKVLGFLLEWGFLLEYWRAYKLYNVLLGSVECSRFSEELHSGVSE